MNAKIKIALLFVVTIVATCGLAYASELAGDAPAAGHGEGHGSSLVQWFWLVVNFAIFASVLFYFLRKPAAVFFRQRTEMIEASLNEAKEARSIAENALKEIDENLRLKDDEIARIIKSARELGEAEKDRLISSGKEFAEKLIELTENNIADELKRAREDLREMAVEQAVELAERRMREKMSDAAIQAGLVDGAIEKIGAKN
ncbi:MAG: ATP synthase F0 subunit B [Nitrospirae bacterium]|uniref:F0F1 ATP synthase subunit B family protein n=1 Tax=Candidatus Magnetobacterium casense TaxID=1455061 RepID=UPI00058BF4A0|nr:ATP synthase F0 subunit B [Candidatus Magnetobacterium casensis]MBF0338383.1 ATP synthase F0 subunit B [Nitrospirota bacterium]